MKVVEFFVFATLAGLVLAAVFWILLDRTVPDVVLIQDVQLPTMGSVE